MSGVLGFVSFHCMVGVHCGLGAFVANEEPDDPPESTSCPSQIQAKSGHASRMHESNRLEEMLLST